jgi:hypothetical protein
MSGPESPDDGAATNPETQTLMQMMKQMMESHSSLEKQVAELMRQRPSSRLPTANDADESFSLKDVYLPNDTFLRTPSNRRSSLLQPVTTAPAVPTSLAVATPFKTEALKTKLNFIALTKLRADWRLYSTQPGNAGAKILLWQESYIPDNNRAKIINQLTKFGNSAAKHIIDDSFVVPSEEELTLMEFRDVFNLLEIAILPQQPLEYEQAIAEIAKYHMSGNIYLSITAQPYYLQKLQTAMEAVEQYLKIAPESKGNSQLPYNLGTRKNHQYGTKGTVQAFMDAVMPTQVQYAVAQLMKTNTVATTLSQHFHLLKTAVTALRTMIDQYEPYLDACLTHDKARRSTSPKHLSSAISKVDDQSPLTQERSDTDPTDPISGITTDEQETEFTAALGGMPPKRTEQEIEDLKKTPCYAFIKGNCKSSTCLRSHDKKIIMACLEEDLRRAKELA